MLLVDHVRCVCVCVCNSLCVGMHVYCCVYVHVLLVLVKRNSRCFQFNVCSIFSTELCLLQTSDDFIW